MPCCLKKNKTIVSGEKGVWGAESILGVVMFGKGGLGRRESQGRGGSEERECQGRKGSGEMGSLGRRECGVRESVCGEGVSGEGGLGRGGSAERECLVRKAPGRLSPGSEEEEDEKCFRRTYGKLCFLQRHAPIEEFCHMHHLCIKSHLWLLFTCVSVYKGSPVDVSYLCKCV